MKKRIAAPFVRQILEHYRQGLLSAYDAAEELNVCRSRVYQLYSDYLRAAAESKADAWSPGVSGGDHAPAWPTKVCDLLKKFLTSKPPSSYSAAASELRRRLDFKTDRASVRRWAIANGMAPDTRYKKAPKPVKRWQAQEWGALWQYDASPHHWLTGQEHKHVLLNLLDDATRYNVGARLYPSETLLAHLDFLDRSFRTVGLPLALYVDYHSFFFTNTPDAFTQLGATLHFYGVTLRFAPTPQAKGKIERRHLYYQGRLPALFAADNIVEAEGANNLLDQLGPHANSNEIHRELGMTPQAAREQALADKRSVLRPVPACPWWPFVFSQRSRVRVGDDGKVPTGLLRSAIDAPPRSTVIRCLRPDGDIFFIQSEPNHKQKPVVLLHHPVF